jgi:outer membrane immunogenic protein
MKKIFIATITTVAFAAPALAADLPVRTYTKAPPPIVDPIYNWTGFYIGLNAGGGSAHDCWTNTSILGVPTVPNILEGCHDATGALAGGQIGYRWQASNWVFGVEGQGDWANLKGSNLSVPATTFLGVPVNNESKLDAIGLITGQVGYAWSNLLWYVKGGAAVTHDTYTGLANPLGFDQASESRWGGAVGTGFEVGFAPNWSVGVEYDHLFMGSRTLTFFSPQLPGITRTDSITQDVDMVTVRVNYRFGGPVVARY